MRQIQVVTWDAWTGVTVVDHVWQVAKHYGEKHILKLRGSAQRWADTEAKLDKSSTHVVYVREV